MDTKKLMNNKLVISNPLIPLVFIIGFIFFYFMAGPIFSDEDTPWHIAAGDFIRDTGSIPETDPWSFTAEGVPWYNISWGWDVAVSWIADIFGVGSLFILACLLKALIVTLTTAILLKRNAASQDPIIIVSGIVMLTLWHSGGIRPQLVSYIMVILFHYILHKSRGNNSVRVFMPLPLLMVVWANLHGGFVAIAAIFAAYGAEAYLARNWKWLGNLVLGGVMCGLAVFATPLGWEMAAAVFATLGSELVLYLGEWHPLTFDTYVGFDILIIAFALATNLTDRDIPVADKVLAIMWFAAALFSVRNFPIFAVLSAPLLAMSLEKALPHKSNNDFSKAGKFIHIGAAVVFVVLLFAPLREISGKDKVIAVDTVPLEALEYIKQNHPNKRFLNDYTIGGYVIYYNRGFTPVFIDGRAETAYPRAFTEKVIELFDGGNPDEIIEEYKIDGLLLMNSNSAYKFPDLHDKTKWHKAFEGRVASIYLRKDNR